MIKLKWHKKYHNLLLYYKKKMQLCGLIKFKQLIFLENINPTLQQKYKSPKMHISLSRLFLKIYND